MTYHGVFPRGYQIRNEALDGNLVHADSLRQQLRLLKNHYHVIAPQDFLRWTMGEASLPPRSILLTCDDALRNSLTEMVPVLQEFGLSCLFFATGESAMEAPSMVWYEELYLMMLEAEEPLTLSLPEVGINIHSITRSEKHSRWWNIVEMLSQVDWHSRRGLLNQIRQQLKLSCGWQQRFMQDSSLAARFLMLDRVGLRQMAAAGMTVGAHSLSHPILARMSDDLAWREISESRMLLEEAMGETVWALAYPFGNSATVIKRDFRMAEQAGFSCAFMNVGGGFGAKIEKFAIPRVHVTAEMKLSEFEAHLTGFYRTLRKRLLGSDES